MTLSVWQETPTGVRGPWVVLDRHPIWERAGDYAEPIMIEQSTVATTHRHVDLHGLGDERMDYRLYCHLRLECSALAQGTDGYALLDFRSEGLGMQLGCIVLSGAVI